MLCSQFVGSMTHHRQLSARFCDAVLTMVLLILVSGCQGDGGVSENDDGTTDVRIALNWYPEAEHGGFYAAETAGYFQQQNLAVELIPGGPAAPTTVISEMAANRILFAVSDADNVVKARAAGVPIVAVLAPMQQSPRCIMVHKSSGITSLQDLQNVDLAISEGRPFALWMKKRLPLTNVNLVPFGGGVGEFLVNDRYAQQGFVFSEPYTAEKQGGDPLPLMVSDTGFNPYASVLITTESAIRERPELVRRVVTACVQGWQQYLKDPEQTNQLIHSCNEEMSLETLAYGAQALVPLCTSDGQTASCRMTLQRWQELVSQIEELGVTEAGEVKPEECFTNDFLPVNSD
ncbi:MAG: ABC transporter substrate-binding protein [Planctomycetaceae bacterium]|nr:ABC transporter substrate-binding protein [Planctomycetaceae bacterium]